MEKLIGERRYELGPMPAMAAMRLQVRLMKMARGSLKGLAAVLGDLKGAGGIELSLDPAALATGVVETLADANDEQLLRESKLLLQGLRCDGKALPPEVWDAHFLGNLTEFWRAVAFGLEVNYGDFFDAARGLASRALVEESEAESSATGSSPGSSLALA